MVFHFLLSLIKQTTIVASETLCKKYGLCKVQDGG